MISKGHRYSRQLQNHTTTQKIGETGYYFLCTACVTGRHVGASDAYMRQWPEQPLDLITVSTPPSYHRSQRVLTINWTIGNKSKENRNRNAKTKMHMQTSFAIWWPFCFGPMCLHNSIMKNVRSKWNRKWRKGAQQRYLGMNSKYDYRNDNRIQDC